MRALLLTVALCLTALAGCPPAPPPQAVTFTVRLTDAGTDPAAVVAAVRSVTGYAEPIAAKLVEQVSQTGVPVGTTLDRAEAESRAAALRSAGAQAHVIEVPGTQ